MIAIAAFALTAATAHAATYTVDSTLDVDDGGAPNNGCEVAAGNECTLREALLAANAAAGPDDVAFSISGAGPHVIQPGTELPPATQPVSVDGTTEPDYVATPVIEIDGDPLVGAESGLFLSTGSGGSVIRGLAIGRFPFSGIRIEGSSGNTVERNHIGLDAGGTLARGNVVGIDVAGLSGSNLIGGTAAADGNLISANNDGMYLRGTLGNTRVENNIIGPSITGADLGNNGRGILADDGAAGDTIGDTTDIGRANTIALNGTGVGVANADVAIGLNSIFANDGGPFGKLGIDLGLNAGLQLVTPNDTDDADTGSNDLLNFPVLDTATVDASQVTVTGTIDLPPGTTPPVIISLYANDGCDPLGFGEGETPLGTDTATSVDANGDVDFMRTLPGTVSSGDEITATTTWAGMTSEFSACLEAIGPPEVSQTVVAGPVSGTILVKVPGGDEFEELDQQQLLPEGTIVDATGGEVRVVSEVPPGQGPPDDDSGTRHAIVSEGRFKVLQDDAAPFTTEFRLAGGTPCGARKRAPSFKRQLNVLAKGRHRSRGRHGAGTVRGTEWLTRDQCNGTFFEVFEGSVKVKDFAKGRNVNVDAGETYLAKKKKG